MLALFGVNKYALFGMGALIVVLSGLCWFLFNQNQNLNAENGILKTNVAQIEKVNESLNATIDSMIERRKQDQIRIDEYAEKINTINQEKSEVVTQFNEYRNRIGALAQKKPGLIGRYASRATNNIMREFACASGYRDEDSCTRTVSPAGADADSTTSKASD